jgi:hypothetical protein
MGTEMGRTCSSHGGLGKYIQNFILKSVKDKPIGRQRYSSENNVKFYLNEMEFTLSEDRILGWVFVYTTMNHLIP